ncbi:hypothetical protein GCM10010530_15750 [Kribbella aluminosa]
MWRTGSAFIGYDTRHGYATSPDGISHRDWLTRCPVGAGTTARTPAPVSPVLDSADLFD